MIQPTLPRICVTNYNLEYWFIADATAGRLPERDIYTLPPNNSPKLGFARYCDECLATILGKVKYPKGMETFREWANKEFFDYGPLYAFVEDARIATHMALPSEVWSIYRIQMMAKHNLRDIQLPDLY